MPKHRTSGPFQQTSPWGVERADRLIDLFSTLSALRSDGRFLVDRIRESLDEMRELRGKLRQQAAQFKIGDCTGRASADLAHGFGLTRREHDVAKLLAQGRSNAAIAGELQISAHTARHHTQRILTKLRVHSRAAAGAKLRA